MQKLLANQPIASIITSEFFSEETFTHLKNLAQLALASSTSLKLLLRVRAAYHKKISKVASQGIPKEVFTAFWKMSLSDVFQGKVSNKGVMARCAAGLVKSPGAGGALARLRQVAKQPASFQQLNAKFNTCRQLLEGIQPGPKVTHALVHEMIIPRACVSELDALFCISFVRMALRTRSPCLHFLDFNNVWTQHVSDVLRHCSAREATAVGVFAREMMVFVLFLRTGEDVLAEHADGSPCFVRHYEDPNNLQDTEQVSLATLGTAVVKWDGRLCRGFREGHESNCPEHKRRALLFLHETIGAFPSVPKYEGAMKWMLKQRRSASKGKKNNAVEDEICRLESFLLLRDWSKLPVV
eukprot:TRINITY_DN25355_c0_g1_i2.p1 TRINITY_DN25355_c0_g1~~TRINITY_DN25355_c0_g1_i2.p1  ORF type:complete len:354 (-),score=37.10 TRINITY_DN25355_c0_g1_i2:244-1305(-)